MSMLRSRESPASPVDELRGEVLMLAIKAVTLPEGPEATAAQGTEGPGERLPFYDQIQAAFGSHDISGIRAHIGGPAAAASRELGARAYAHGSNVAFASAPDLHTAAHEAAHVVQQGRGVHLKALDGGSSDGQEQHADAVADAVVRGESAQALLDPFAGKGGGAAVQRKTDPATGDDHDNDRRSYPREGAQGLLAVRGRRTAAWRVAQRARDCEDQRRKARSRSERRDAGCRQVHQRRARADGQPARLDEGVHQVVQQADRVPRGS
ncbi:MAG: DUF4157 domain-containing protein [Deltaproteobacteria bacterium]|nr:DUF4157 domain-containing protein [Deltaproteobacteria bacterium]